jgi:hypothetical protein
MPILGAHSRWSLARIVAAVVSFLPFAPGLATGGSFYFRDLSSQFFPIRRFVVEGLLRGELRQWNPYMNEGVPVMLPPAGYPIDWLQALAPNEWGFSLLLALHVPIAALTFLDLARRLGHGPQAATLGALVYALSGFSLSSVNLYLHVQAFAWAPLVVAMLIRASTGGAREIAVAGAAVALCLSTTGVEIAAQALACGFVLAASRSALGHLRLAAGIALGIGIAASPLVGLFSLLTGSRRASGLGVAEVLDQSVHPVSLLQTLVAGLYGDPVASGYGYWGARFLTGSSPFPYFVSLYLGGAVLCLVALGARSAERHRTRLLLLLAAALVISLGRWARLDLLLEIAPFLAKFRFPVKAFFTVVLASSLLASAGADQLLASRRAWRPLLAGSALLGLGLASLWLVPSWLPGGFAWLQQHFFLESYPHDLRAAALRSVAADAATGAVALLAVAAIAALALARRLSAELALVAATAVIAADLLRAGAGLNPTTHFSFYAFSPEMTQVAATLRDKGGRAFTCSIHAMPTYRDAVRRVGRPDLWTAAVWRESLSPYVNMDAGIQTTGADATALVPSALALSTADAMCREAGTLERLRASGVRYILSVQPFTNEALRLAYVASPARTAPLSVHVYELENALPDPTLWLGPDDLDQEGRARVLEGALARYVLSEPGLVRVMVETPREAHLILRRTHARGWSASVGGRPAEIVTANGRHQAVAVPAGKSEVVLRYRPPNAWLGATLSLLSAAVAAALWSQRPRGMRAYQPPVGRC